MTSPLVTLPLTVHVLDTSIISVYALLAADTLCFASKADHAVEHENRCLQVYSRRTADGNPSGGSSIGVGSTSSLFRRTEIGSFTSQTSDSSSSVASGISGKDNNKAILAWGSGADKRWRELIQVTESEDQVDEEPFGKSLLSVPSGSSSTQHASSADKKKAAEAADNANKKIRRRRPLLLFFPQHNDSNKLGVYRSLTLLQK
jgi:hypothetical protein